MGGNAFPDTARLTPAEHSRIRHLVLSSLTQSPQLSPTLLVTSSAELLDKSSFGDVDFYASCNPTYSSSSDRVLDAMIEFLVETLRSPENPVRNGRNVSFLTVERYQVDVGFAMDPAQLRMHASVYSNGDFARLLQVSLTGRGLGLTSQGLFLRGKPEKNVSKQERSFLLSLDPTKVSEFLGLPPDAFDGRNSLSLSRAFDLVVSNRFFDAAAMTTWTQTVDTVTSKRRPMIESFYQWWHSTGTKASSGNPSCDCDCGDKEAWVDFFGARERYREWKGKGAEKEKEMEMRKECKKLLNFGLIQSWFPVLSNARVGEVLRKLYAEHGQLGSVEFQGWVGSMAVEEVKKEVRGIALEIERGAMQKPLTRFRAWGSRSNS